MQWRELKDLNYIYYSKADWTVFMQYVIRYAAD